MTLQLPSIAEAKAQAASLRQELARQGTEIGHARALELVAHQHGFRDWNAFHAAIGNRPPADWTPGGKVIIPLSVSNEQAKEIFPKGWDTLRPYLRVTEL